MSTSLLSFRLCCVAILASASAAFAQVAPATPKPSLTAPAAAGDKNKPWPFSKPAAGASKTTSPGAAAVLPTAPPPREVPLVEKAFEQLTSQEVSDYGKKALAINALKWKHAETENFLLHYRRATEAQKVAREVEYDLYYIATTLGATKERYSRKSHVYVFEDEDEWKQFLAILSVPKWSASFARGDELYLNVRREGGGFGSQTLAHETSHAVVARLFPGKRWPLWLNEGFAEYMGGASIAARKGQSVKRFQGRLEMAEMPLSTLESLTDYPSDNDAVGQLYQSSEKFIRFLMNELPKDRIVAFIDAILAGKKMQEAVLEVYGDKLKDWDAFTKRYERFSK